MEIKETENSVNKVCKNIVIVRFLSVRIERKIRELLIIRHYVQTIGVVIIEEEIGSAVITKKSILSSEFWRFVGVMADSESMMEFSNIPSLVSLCGGNRIVSKSNSLYRRSGKKIIKIFI